MNGACLKESLVYYATISCNYKPKLYKGSYETSFKKGYSNDKKSKSKAHHCKNMIPSYQQSIGT